MDQKNTTSIQKCDKYQISGKQNLKGSCRVCMTQSTNMRDIFDVKSNIISKIEFCTGLKLLEQEGLPSQICDICLTDLSVAHKFKTMCVHTDEVLQNFLIENLKVELDDDDYDCYNGVSDDDAVVYKVKEELVVKKEDSKCKPRIKPSVRKKSPSRTLKKKLGRLYCEVCEMKFETLKTKDEHVRKLHKSEIETFICEICGKVFLHRASLFSHSRSHLPPQFACSSCDYVTWHKHDLAKHVLIHTGDKRFQCEYCTSSYYTSSNLMSHIRRSHQKLKRYACTLCDMRFYDTTKLNRHLDSHNDVKRKEVCNSSNLMSHIRRSHQKLKRYACTLCDMRFYDTTKLNRHLDSHNDVKRFECQVCHSCFTRRCYWKKHLQRQHNIAIPPQRPGKPKTNMIIGQDIPNTTFDVFVNK